MPRAVDVYEIEIGSPTRRWLARVGEGVKWEAMTLTADEAARLIDLMRAMIPPPEPDVIKLAELTRIAAEKAAGQGIGAVARMSLAREFAEQHPHTFLALVRAAEREAV